MKINIPFGEYGYPRMTEKEKELKNKLNIGCGWKKEKGFINIDSAKEVKPDKIVNIEKGLPFPDNYFDYIYSSHALEHINPSKWKFALNEIGRVAKDGCILELDLPFDNISCRSNIVHYRGFNWSSFDEISDMGCGLRFYFYPFALKWIIPKPNKLLRIFCNMFPFIVDSIQFKFEIIKKKKWGFYNENK